MKIVQSFWSKPSISHKNDWDGNLKRGETGGWLGKKAYYRSWALSCLRLRQYYKNVELVTDTAGKEILIDYLALPYTSVRVDLDCLSDEHIDLWALGKIYTYGLQEEQFIHVDSDVYIWGQISKIDRASLMVQNFEKHSYFNDILREYRAIFPFFPACLEECVGSKETVQCINAGIFGGNDCSFIREYAQTSLNFVKKNKKFFKQNNVAAFNIVFEQILFFYLAKQNSRRITPLFEETIVNYDRWIVNFEDVPRTTKYIHAVGKYKRDPKINNLVAEHLQMDFPEYYRRIEEVIS